MASWHPSLCLFIMGPRCPARTWCPSRVGDLVQQQMGRRKELATQTIAAGVYFLKYLGAQMGIDVPWWKPRLSSSSCTPGHQVSADRGHLAMPMLSCLTYHLEPCLLPCRPQRCHEVALVSSGAVNSLQSWFPTFSLSWTILFLILFLLDGSLIKILSSKLYRISIKLPP